ncbi:MAG TPA: glycosyltransferase family 4 protein [Candidatus Acidoferrales bacterium]|nr:glycosyltransferase family 4 protein [Candidatus Acidoferrales bacterium]
MRIGVFDPYLDDFGGGEKYMMMLASCLAQQHDVSIFWDNESEVEALRKRFGLPLKNITIAKNIFSPAVSFIVRTKAVRSYDAIIILSDGSIPFIFPTKLYLHIQQPLPKNHSRSFKDKIKLKHISAIFYNSEFTKKFNDPIFPGVKNTVIYPPVKLDLRFKIEDIRKENVIVHVGRFRVKNVAAEDYKKQGFMIDAFKKLVDTGFKNWKFIIAASVKNEDIDAFAHLQTKAEGYPIEFHINKTNSELFELYNKAKIYWHASGYGEDLEKHPELAEHFGITTVEAMGSGVVPIVINSGGQREIVTDGKNGLLWDTLEEFFEKTKKIADDEDFRQNLAKNAIIRAKDFSEEKFCKSVHDLVK